MKKIITLIVCLVILTSISYIPVLAQTTSTVSTFQELFQSLQQQIEKLRNQIEALEKQLESIRQSKGEIKETVKEVKEILKLVRQLRFGMTGDDVKLLQEILATDSDIYPEGLITGYFGPMTERAVKRFQKKVGLEQVGNVGPKTFSKINEILKEGAGSSGKVPPGLLIAPGIRKKLGFQPQPLPGQEIPYGISKKLTPATSTPATTTADVVAPVISELAATSTAATSTNITWLTDELASSKVWYSTTDSFIVATSTLAVSSASLVLNHNIVLFDLTASTTYYYIAVSTDAAGNTATSSQQSFSTL